MMLGFDHRKEQPTAHCQPKYYLEKHAEHYTS